MTPTGTNLLGLVKHLAGVEAHRHAGHADDVREAVDGRAGLRADAGNLPEVDTTWWAAHVARLEDIARRA